METFLNVCVAGLGVVVLLSLVRLAKGPTVVDRMLAFDLIAVSGVALIAVVSVQRSTSLYLELILVYSLLGFLGTVALAGYLQRSQERERSGGAGGGKEGPGDC